MKGPLVSIVMPVFRKEKYVGECVRSILDQTYENFELICIDDHSPDGCGAILKKLADRDPRMKVITNDVNKGAAVSRNLGLEMARGKYLSVLDADDLYVSEFVEKAVLRCEQDRLDVLLYDFRTYNDGSGEKVERHMPYTFRKAIDNGRVFSKDDIAGFSFQMCTASGCTKFYDRKLIERNHIRFQDISSANEALFNRLAVACAERIGYVDRCWMDYRIGTEDRISNRSGEHSLNYAKMGVALKRELVKRDLYEDNKRSFHTYIFKCIMAYIGSIDMDEWETYHDRIKDALSEIIDEIDGAFLCPYYGYWYQDFMKLTCRDDVDDALINEYRYIFRYEKSKVGSLKKYIVGNGAKVALWGYGRNGKAFYHGCEENGLHIDSIIDGNPKDRMVSSPRVLQGEKYIVLVASADLVEDICKQASLINGLITIVDIQSFFSYGLGLGECIYPTGMKG